MISGEEITRKMTNSEIPAGFVDTRVVIEKKDPEGRRHFERKLISSESKKKSSDEKPDGNDKLMKRKGSDLKPEEARIVSAVFKDDIIKVGEFV